MANKDEIFSVLKDALVELFEIDPDRIKLSANIYEDLEIDSIDAIDLAEHLRKKTGVRMEAADFKSVRTLEDIVEIIAKHLENTQK